MLAHPLQGLPRWLGLPLLCGASGGMAGLLAELGSDSEFSWMGPVFGAALAAGVGTAGSLSSSVWLNVVLSPVLSWVYVAGAVRLVTSRAELLGWSFILGVLWMPQFRMMILLSSVPAAGMHAWRLRRGRARLRLEIPLAVGAGLAIALASSVSSSRGWKLWLSETIFLVSYFLGNVLAMEVALRISRRKANASPR